MQKYRNGYSQSPQQKSYGYKSDMELDPELELDSESDSNYEFEGASDMEHEDEYESDYELQPEFDLEEEADYENPYNMESESDYESNEYEQAELQDEVETELELVSNEQEFETWVKKVVTRDHRRLAPVLRTPVGRRAIRQFSKIAFKTLPFIGRRIPGFRRPYPYWRPNANRFNMPWNRRWSRRYPWRPGMPPQSYPYPGMQQQAMPDLSQPQSTAFPDTPQTAPIQPDGSFKNFVLSTIKSLSDQIAQGNESIAALKTAITTSAANNFPAIVQPKMDSPDQSAQNSPMPPGNPGEPPPTGEFEFEDYEFDGEGNFENEYETDGEVPDNESSFSEETEMELASELLSINNEMELDHFLGLKLLKRAVGGFSKLLRSPSGKLLKKGFLQILRKALPIAGGVVGGPAGAVVGNAIGSAVASNATEAKELFELELEGLSNEDSEFEIAKAFIRFAGNAAKEANESETGNPAKDAEMAMIRAARRFAPGLLRRRSYGYNRSRFQQSYDQNEDNGGNDGGSWYRRGNKIIIQNAF